MSRRRDTDCALDACDGSGWLDLTEDPDTEQTPCPCGRGIPLAAPPPDLHDRIMDAIRDEQAKREAQQAIHRSYNGGGR